MKATVAQLKTLVKNMTHLHVTGIELDKRNPYWMNSEQIGYMNEAVTSLAARDITDPKRYAPSPKQVVSLTNWVSTLEQTYTR